MGRQKIEKYIDNYINEVEDALHHPILERDMGRGVLNTSKAFFILLPMLNGERWTTHLNTAAIAVGAVQLAFEAHDSIDESDSTSTEQQLTVLSGDYFSGIHYKLLASIGDFGFIRSLSNTIGRINEVKTGFHYHTPTNAGQFLDGLRDIEAGCIIDFLHSFGFSKYVPLVVAALPLLSIDSEIGGNDLVLSGNSRHESIVGNGDNPLLKQVTSMLRAELFNALDEVGFIEPYLLDEIRSMTTSLLGKPI